jgi:GT2 family glycosyltransferase
MSEVLAVIPSYVRTSSDLEVLLVALQTLRSTAPDLETLVVDDGSVDELVDEIEGATERLQFRLHRKVSNTGFSSTVNVGLAEALERGMDAVLINADVEFSHPDWLERMVAQPSENGDPAAVVGARLLYPNGLIQHGGIFFSLLSRCFGHIHQYAPHDLPEAQYARTCPVTGALQLIRHQALADIGLYDEDYRLGWEDVDYCLRVFLAGGTCVMQPAAVAIHHESLFRRQTNARIIEWQQESWAHFHRKHRQTPLAAFVPSII